MPKAYATCTCRTCKKEFTKELYESGKGASKRLREKVEWAENGGIDECPDCWKARQRAEEKAAGLTCEIRLGSVYDQERCLYAVFGGDSYSHKDELKAAGCHWTEEYPEKNVLADALMLGRPRKAWVLRGTEPKDLVDKAKELGATVTIPSEQDLAIWSSFRLDVENRRKKEQEKVEAEAAGKQSRIDAAMAELGPIPAWPESIKAKWPDGARWNGKIYGKAGYRNVFFSGEKVSLTDEEADAMEQTAEARAEWRKKKAEIEKGA